MAEEAIYAYRFEGKRFDCGSKLGYLQATVEFALAHPQIETGFRRYLRDLDVSRLAVPGGPALKSRAKRAAQGRPRKR